MKIEKIFAVLLIFAGIIGLYFLKDEAPIIRLIASSLGMIWIIKIAALIWQKSDGIQLRSPLGTFIFLFAWPGVSVQGFTQRQEIHERTGLRFFEAWITFIAGTVILVVASVIGRGESTILNYVALFSILLIVHLGVVCS